jgi:hypothetical protein
VERKLAILPVALSCFVHRRRGLAKVEDLDPTSSRAVAEYLSVLDMDVEATTAIRQVEVGAAKTMLDRTAEEFDVQPSRLVADAGYGSAEMLGWLVDERGIEPHVKVFDKSERTDGAFSRGHFAYDTEADVYICPGGNELMTYRRAFAVPRDGVMKDGTIRYRASKFDCEACALKPKFCPNAVARRSLARSTKPPATRPELSPKRRWSRCCLRISSASSGLTDCACGVRTGRRTSSYWPPLPRICGNWRSSSRCRRRSSQREARRPEFSSLTAVADDRRRQQTGFVNGIDPLLPFKIGPVNGREARESGPWLKASVARGAVVQ